MILVVSHFDDVTTNKVLSYLNKWNCEFIRINDDDELEIDGNIFNPRIVVKSSNRIFSLNDIDVIWQRRGTFFFGNIHPTFINENKVLVEHIFLLMKHKSYGDILGEFNHNKLHDLWIATSVGLRIPYSFFTQTIRTISKEKLITKSLHNAYRVYESGVYYRQGDPCIIDSTLKDKVYYPSLIQEYIDKRFEIRSFVFGENIFSAAIFSQNNPMTRLSYKNYDYNTPNRIVPFTLPQDVRLKIVKLFKSLELNSGSIDLLYCEGHEFVFLEINRCGQIDWISGMASLNIEKYIAHEL